MWLITENTNARFVDIFMMRRWAILILGLLLALYGKMFQTIGVALNAV